MRSIKDFVLKYLNTNVEDSVGSRAVIGQTGRQRGAGDRGQSGADSGGAVLSADGLGPLCGPCFKPLCRRACIAAFDSFTKEADAVLGQYLRGQLLVMLALAVFYSVGLALFGLDLAWPIGIFTGLGRVCAVSGLWSGAGFGAVGRACCNLRPSKRLVMVAVVYGAGQVVESFYLTPRLVGERIGLHPLAVIFALMAFGQLFGFVGVSDCLACQRRAAGGHAPRAGQLHGQQAVPGLKAVYSVKSQL